MKTYFNQKPIVKISLIFFIAYTIIVVFKLALSNYIVNNIYSSLTSKIFTLIIFSLTLFFFLERSLNLFQINKKKIQRIDFFISLILIILFFFSNFYSISKYGGTELFKLEINNYLLITIIRTIISSTAEEIAYRGLIQTYIDKNLKSNYSIITKGNLYATLIMVILHLGFFTVMQTDIAIISLFLVIISSIVLGYIRTKTDGIVAPIVLHISCNLIHILSYQLFLN